LVSPHLPKAPKVRGAASSLSFAYNFPETPSLENPRTSLPILPDSIDREGEEEWRRESKNNLDEQTF